MAEAKGKVRQGEGRPRSATVVVFDAKFGSPSGKTMALSTSSKLSPDRNHDGRGGVGGRDGSCIADIVPIAKSTF